jgi:hypothetical protein
MNIFLRSEVEKKAVVKLAANHFARFKNDVFNLVQKKIEEKKVKIEDATDVLNEYYNQNYMPEAYYGNETLQEVISRNFTQDFWKFPDREILSCVFHERVVQELKGVEKMAFDLENYSGSSPKKMMKVAEKLPQIIEKVKKLIK